MIIIEGTDGAGKSHLIQRLKLHFNAPIANRSMSADQEPLVDMKAWIQQCVALGFRRVLFDRFALISGPLYAPILKDEYQLGIYQDLEWMVEQYYLFNNKVRPIIVYCIPPLETVKVNIDNDENNRSVALYTEQLYVAYTNRAAQDCNFMSATIFDYTNPQHFEKIIEFIGYQLTLRGKR